MFEIGTTELLLIAVVALLVIGPKELPNALRQLGRMTGKARAMTRHLRSGFDEMMRQAELEEMEKQWREHNARVMQETPQDPFTPAPATAEPSTTEPAPPGPVDPVDPLPANPVGDQPIAQSAPPAAAEASAPPLAEKPAQ